MSILVIAEHINSRIRKSTLGAVTAAKALGDDIHVLVAGSNCGDAATEAAKIDGVSKVLKSDGAHLEHFLAENIAPIVVGIADSYSHILAPATTMGKNVMPRIAALLDLQMISDISSIIDEKTFARPIYGGQTIAEVQTSEDKVLLTTRGTAFDPAPAEGGSANVEDIAAGDDFGKSSFVGLEVSGGDRPELTSAKVVVSGGRGFESGENFEKVLEPLADKLGAAIGASRAAVDAGYVPNDYQVGQTGKIVAPDLYIAIGISGAIQHMAGMKDSKVIVAINKDEEAPIFQVADYGLVADLFDAVPELIEKL